VTTGKRLGCGDYRVFLQAVGGTPVLAELGHSSVAFSRRLDEFSESRIELSSEQDVECLAHLGDVSPWNHELSIWRDEDEAWVGPITEPLFSYEGMTLTARDLFAWFERRIFIEDQLYVSTDLASIAQGYADAALSQDPTPNIMVSTSPTGILGTRSIFATLHRRVADELRELSRTGLDFTAIARELRFGGSEIGTPSIGTLTADIFEVTDARLAGLSMANHVFVLGSSGGGVNSPTVGEAGGITVPLLQQVYTESSILDVSSANVAALTRLDLLGEPPLFVSGTLLEDAPIPFTELVPGALLQFQQQVGFRFFDVPMRLLSVDVSASASDSGVSEAVTLTLEPIGTTESA